MAPLRALLILCLGLVLAPQEAYPRADSGVDYRAAFAALDSGQYAQARSAASRGPDVVLNNVLRLGLMAKPGNDYGFDDLSQFVAEHPDWPNLNGVLMIAEQKIPQDFSPQQIFNWFSAHPPLALPGFYRYMDALNDTRQSQLEAKQVRAYWVGKDFTPGEMIAFRSRFQPLLRQADDQERLSRLVWQGKIAGAKAMYAYVGSGWQALAEARLALAGQTNNADAFIARVPVQLRTDAELRYELLRWNRKRGNDTDANTMLLQAPANLGHAEAWWDERNIMIRRAMERHDYQLAYNLAKDHGLDTGFSYLQAEFMAGWLALRFLNQPALAGSHFEAMIKDASTPISRARGYYWLGRTNDALGDKAAARTAYESASALSLTFYGQLATARLNAKPVLHAPHEPNIPDNVRGNYLKRDVIQAIDRLTRIGQNDRARIFYKAALDAATKRVEFVLLMEKAYKMQRPDWAITAGKAANQKNMVVAAQSYPLLTTRIPTPPELAFSYAVIRQESLFNTDARSPAGARGLMQLMPATAKEVAHKQGMPYSESRLTDPAYNLRLGTAFVQSQLDNFNGSYILALAGYNAGPRRAREWMETWGDPRSPRVDAIDWIELIPIYETRNYVQRIIENLQIYRARLNNGEAPLRIMDDLKR